MSKKKNYEPTEKGYKEVEDIKETVPTKAEQEEIEELAEEKEEKKKSTSTKSKIPADQDLSVPYSDLGHSVQQLAGMEEHKRKSILGEKDAEFVKKYL